jgi:hypothetical protein
VGDISPYNIYTFLTNFAWFFVAHYFLTIVTNFSLVNTKSFVSGSLHWTTKKGKKHHVRAQASNFPFKSETSGMLLMAMNYLFWGWEGGVWSRSRDGTMLRTEDFFTKFVTWVMVKFSM